VSASGASAEGAQVSLYGLWQTQPWAPPAANDGVVPTNERGNVEVPPLAKALPAGTVHLKLPALGPLCRKLGISWAPALVGFEPQGGRMVPRLEGVVICQVRGGASTSRMGLGSNLSVAAMVVTVGLRGPWRVQVNSTSTGAREVQSAFDDLCMCAQ